MVQAGQTRAPGRILVVVLAGGFMATLDVFIVNVAGPSIQRELPASFDEVQLVIAAYLVTYGACLVLAARIGDALGHRRLFLVGLTAFVVTSALCAAAGSAPWLIAFRCAQGGAAAVMLPQGLWLLQTSFPDPEPRRRAIAARAATIGLGSALGQLVGGSLIHLDLWGLGWRSAFLINVPIGVSLVVGAAVIVPADEPTAHSPLDPVGALLSAAWTLALLIALVEGPVHDWPPWTLAMVPCAAALLCWFLLAERRTGRAGRTPLLPAELVTKPGFVTGALAAGVFFAGNSGLFVDLAYHLQLGLGLGPLGAGAVFAPLGAGFLAGALLAGTGLRAAVPVGASLLPVSLFAAALIVHTTTAGAALVPALLVNGIGQGLIAPRLIGLILQSVPRSLAGSASGAVLTIAQLSSAIGVAAAGACYEGILGGSPTTSRVTAHDTAFSLTLCVLAGVAGLLAPYLYRVVRDASSTAPA